MEGRNICAPRKSRESSRNSYLGPSQAQRRQKFDRKVSVKDSLSKFLADCEDDDLLMGAHIPSPRRKTSALSMSEHSPLKKSQSLSRSSHTPRTKASGSSQLSSTSHGPLTITLEPKKQRRGRRPDRKSCDASVDTVSTDGDSFAGDDVSLSSEEEETGSVLPFQSKQSRERRQSARERSTHRRSTPRSGLRRTVSSSTPRTRTASRGTRGTLRRRRSEHGLRRRKDSENSPRQRKGALDQKLGSSSHHRRSISGDGDDLSVGGRSTQTTRSTRSGRSIGLDAGPLNAFLNTNERRMSGFSGDGGSICSASTDPKFLERRKERQDAILDLAKGRSLSLKAEEEEMKQRMASDDDIESDNDNDSLHEHSKRGSALSRLKRGLSKTRKVTKDTVNVVKDPKLAAKKVGGAAKVIGKETVKMALDPTLAAKRTVNLGKHGITNTFQVTKNVGTGVAKGGLGLTKTVAKTGVNATTLVVGTAVSGAANVVHDVTGLIFKNGGGEDGEEYQSYDASKLASRRKESFTLLDRVTTTVRDESPDNDAPVPLPSSVAKPSLNRKTSLLVPTAGLGGKSSWDF